MKRNNLCSGQAIQMATEFLPDDLRSGDLSPRVLCSAKPLCVKMLSEEKKRKTKNVSQARIVRSKQPNDWAGKMIPWLKHLPSKAQQSGFKP